MVIVPTDTIRPFWSQITTLDGIDFILNFRYNQREDCYYLQILLTDQTLVAQGIKLVSNYRLFQAYTDANMPPGEMVCVAAGVDDSPAKFGELGARVAVVYYTQAEMQVAHADEWRL